MARPFAGREQGAAGAVRRPVRPAVADRRRHHAAQSAGRLAERRWPVRQRRAAAIGAERHRSCHSAGLLGAEEPACQSPRARGRAALPALADRISRRVDELDERGTAGRLRRSDRQSAVGPPENAGGRVVRGARAAGRPAGTRSRPQAHDRGHESLFYRQDTSGGQRRRDAGKGSHDEVRLIARIFSSRVACRAREGHFPDQRRGTRSGRQSDGNRVDISGPSHALAAE
jgi:hypothetical protein